MLVLQNLTKKFGDLIAVNNISFRVQKGEIFGLLGENGAGKTTTLRMLATMLKPSSGTAKICGFDIKNEPDKVRGHIGILFGGEIGLYDRLTAAENIRYFAELNDMNKSEIDERIDYLAKTFEMEDFLNKKASKLSKGMKQKVAFARSIVHNPDIMLFDEPSSGLDVSALREVHRFILDCKKEGKVIVFSSHTMSEVEKLCDRIGIIHKGVLAAEGTVGELKEIHKKDSIEEVFVKLVGGKNEI